MQLINKKKDGKILSQGSHSYYTGTELQDKKFCTVYEFPLESDKISFSLCMSGSKV